MYVTSIMLYMHVKGWNESWKPIKGALVKTHFKRKEHKGEAAQNEAILVGCCDVDCIPND